MDPGTLDESIDDGDLVPTTDDLLGHRLTPRLTPVHHDDAGPPRSRERDVPRSDPPAMLRSDR